MMTCMFGGMTLVLGSDLKQTLFIVERGEKKIDSLDAFIKRSYL